MILSAITYSIGIIALYYHINKPLNEVGTWIAFFIAVPLIINPVVEYWVNKFNECK